MRPLRSVNRCASVAAMGRKLSPKPDSTCVRLAPGNCQSSRNLRVPFTRRSTIFHTRLELSGNVARLADSKVGEFWKFVAKYSGKKRSMRCIRHKVRGYKASPRSLLCIWNTRRLTRSIAFWEIGAAPCRQCINNLSQSDNDRIASMSSGFAARLRFLGAGRSMSAKRSERCRPVGREGVSFGFVATDSMPSGR
jgi:hypothetical protein